MTTRSSSTRRRCSTRSFKEDAKAASERSTRLGGLQLEDGLKFSDKRRISASVRDFARIAWFWFNRGNWNGKQLLPKHYFDDLMVPQVAKDLPNTQPADTDDYLGISTYGGGSDHFARCGPGIYGFNWWFNGTSGRHPDTLTWPDAPADTIMSIGARGNNAAIIPSLGLVLVCASGDWNDLDAGNSESKINQSLKLLVSAVDNKPPADRSKTTFTEWQPATLSFSGPELSESGTPNPFTDFRLEVTFQKGDRRVVVPGFFAADGNSAETSADAGHIWQVSFLPDEAGDWTLPGQLSTGNRHRDVTHRYGRRCRWRLTDRRDRFKSNPPMRTRRDSIARDCCNTWARRYLRFAETNELFLKGGADSPENLLAFADFDQTSADSLVRTSRRRLEGRRSDLAGRQRQEPHRRTELSGSRRR